MTADPIDEYQLPLDCSGRNPFFGYVLNHIEAQKRLSCSAELSARRTNN